MNKTNCNDRDGQNHFGEYGWYDGYTNSSGNCRVGLKARSGACSDADLCCEECQSVVGKKQTNIVSECLNNMNKGANQRNKETEDDKKIAETRRQKEKDEAKKMAEDQKKKEESSKVKVPAGEYSNAIHLSNSNTWVEDGTVKFDEQEGYIEDETEDLMVVRMGKDAYIFIDKPKKEDKKELKPEPKVDIKEEPKVSNT